MTEYQLSQWISQSLAGELSDQQRAELQNALEKSPASRAFADWSRRIQAATSHGEQDMNTEDVGLPADSTQSLSELSKERMRRTVRAALADYQSDSSQQQHLLVAQPPATYLNSRSTIPPHDNESLDNHTLPTTSIQRAAEALAARGRDLRERLNSQIASQTVAGLAITETDIARQLCAIIAALDIEDEVLLVDGRGSILFSSKAASRDATGPVGQTLAGWQEVLHELSDSGEVFHPELGIWVTTIACPAPLDVLRLVMRR